MRWKHLYIFPPGKAYDGVQARQFVAGQGIQVDDRFQQLVVLKHGDKPDRLLARPEAVLGYLAKKLDVECRWMPPAGQTGLQVPRGHGGNPIITEWRPPASEARPPARRQVLRRHGQNPVITEPTGLQMYVDAGRSGGYVLADDGRWEWGAGGRGAIVLVNQRDYRRGDVVVERLPIHFEWHGDYTPGWEALLAVDNPHKVRVFDDDRGGEVKGNREGAELVIGPPPDGPLVFEINDWWEVYSTIEQAQHADLWIEATDYPALADDDRDDWEVTLLFKFTPKVGQPSEQMAVLRIAPWIMASDLESAAMVVAGYKTGNRYTCDQLQTSLAGFKPDLKFKEYCTLGKRPFVRDAFKAGFSTAPDRATRVLVSDIEDDQSGFFNDRTNDTLEKVKQALPEGESGNVGLVSSRLHYQMVTRTTQGGNYMVSPPTRAWPYGRIVLGHTRNFPCRLRNFFAAQRVQQPIVLDTDWLKVGHADEVITFVPDCREQWRDRPWDDPQRPYRVLVASPLLAYILTYGAAHLARPPAPEGGLVALYERAEQVRKQAIPISKEVVENALTREFGPPFRPRAVVPQSAFTPDQPDQKDPQPAATWNGCVVRAVNDGGTWYYQPQDITLYLSDRRLEEAVELQRRIDAGSRAPLERELGLRDTDFIDIPVLFTIEDGQTIAGTADSTNMLVVTRADGRGLCLMAKPFGPVVGEHWVFDDYIRHKLEPLRLTVEFINEWASYHVEDGEVHCGTNQVPALDSLETRKWWEMDEPAAAQFEPWEMKTVRLPIVFQDEARITAGCALRKRDDDSPEVKVEIETVRDYPGIPPAIRVNLAGFDETREVTVAYLIDHCLAGKKVPYRITEPRATRLAWVERIPEPEPVEMEEGEIPPPPPMPGDP